MNVTTIDGNKQLALGIINISLNLNINIKNTQSVMFSLKKVVYMQLQKQEYMVHTLFMLIFGWVLLFFKIVHPGKCPDLLTERGGDSHGSYVITMFHM